MNWTLPVLMIGTLLSLVRMFAGPTLWDRVISLQLVSVHVVLAMCLFAVEHGRPFYLDVAAVYALLSFAETVAFARLWATPGQEPPR
ncbi:MAG: monovalent cation/H+ antiporter complex subunit F [Kiritimatiellae bacterium]|nr:monovalent cation/H+ antiporter complex subunit F [Kiritimatiellia bacterium]